VLKIDSAVNGLSMSTNFSAEDWITPAEAARLRGVSRQAIAKLVRSRRLRLLNVGGHTFVNKEDVVNFVRQKPGRPSGGTKSR
jgi:excisionase family DNA binding protein